MLLNYLNQVQQRRILDRQKFGAGVSENLTFSIVRLPATNSLNVF
jgi:hypothetical protein